MFAAPDAQTAEPLHSYVVEQDTLKIVAHAAHPSLVGTSPEDKMPNSKRALQDSPDDLDGDGTALDPYVTSTARDQTSVPGIAWFELHDGTSLSAARAIPSRPV